MKRACMYLLAVLGLPFATPFASAQVVPTPPVIGEITTTFTSLFAAFRAGDVRTITSFLSAEEYARNKVLFEQNKDYPRFLRNFYQEAGVRVGEIHSILNAGNDVVAEFIVEFPSGETINTRMRLTRGAGGRWIVKKYLADKYDQGESFGTRR
jgi:hypothetical protein